MTLENTQEEDERLLEEDLKSIGKKTSSLREAVIKQMEADGGGGQDPKGCRADGKYSHVIDTVINT